LFPGQNFSKSLQSARAGLHLARQSEFFVLGFVGTLPAKARWSFFGIKTVETRALIVWQE
jgi:hypothetical protein